MQSLRYAVRSLLRAPLLSAVTILTLAVGIGLNAGAFTVVNGMMFRARIQQEPDSFVQLVSSYAGTFRQPGAARAFTTADFEALRTRARSLGDVAAWRDVHVHFGDEADSTLAMVVTCEFFRLYGLSRPLAGRLFSQDECAAHDSPPLVLVSEELWRGRLAAAPGVVGRTALLDGAPYTIVGVVPEGFSGRLRGPGIWLLWRSAVQSGEGRRAPSPNATAEAAPAWLNVEGRLRPGVSTATALAEIKVILADQDRLHAGRTTSVVLTNGSIAQDPAIGGTSILIVALVMGALLLVVLIACVNVTTILLSRAVSRRSELAVRLSLGASRRRLLAMLTVEGMLLAGLAGGLGLLLAVQTTELFRRMLPADAPHYPMHIGSAEVLYVLAITLLAGCIVSWAPAAESLRVDVHSMLTSSSPGAGRRSRMQNAIVMGQVALSLGLTVAAGGFLRFQYDVAVSDPGFDTRQVLVVPLPLRTPRYDAASAASFRQEAERRLRELPGVRTVASGAVPFGGSSQERVFPHGADGGVDVDVDGVSADYFDALQLGMVRGRAFRPGDPGGDAPVAAVVVSKAFVDAYWNGQEPLEQTIRTAAGGVWRVIGVARDTKARQYGAADPPRIYRLRGPDAADGPLLVRVTGEPGPVATAIRARLAGMDPQLHVIPRTVRSEMEEVARRLWLLTGLVSFLAGVAVLLAMTGLYAILAFSVQQRTMELGLRVALGATHGRILYAVLSWGARPVVAGAAAGIAIAVAGLFVLRAALAGIPEAGAVRVRPIDPMVCLLALSVLTLVALAATMGPARRALRLSPWQCLRRD